MSNDNASAQGTDTALRAAVSRETRCLALPLLNLPDFAEGRKGVAPFELARREK